MMIAISPRKEDEAGIGVEGGAPDWGDRHLGTHTHTYKHAHGDGEESSVVHMAAGSYGIRQQGTPRRPGQEVKGR